MNKTVVAIAVIGAVVLATAAVYAQGPGFGMGGRGMGWAMARTNLTPEKRAELDKVRQEHWAEMSQLREQIVTKRTELAAARDAGDQPKVDALTKELNTLYAEHAAKRDAHRTKMAALAGTDMPMGPGKGRGMGMGFGPRGAMGSGCPNWQ